MEDFMNERDLIVSLMEKERITRSELARRVGKSRQSITNFFNQGRESMYVSELERFVDALGYELVISVRKKG